MDVSKLLDKAEVAFERNNYDYAIDLYLQLLELQPDHTEARKRLRAVEVRKFQEQGVTSANPMVWLTGAGPLLTASFFYAIRKYEKAMQACEQFLKKDPHNASVLTLLARSATKAGFNDTAILVYEDLRSRMGEPKGKVAASAHCRRMRSLGNLYEEEGDFPRAAQCFEEVRRHRPTDREADIKIRDLAARRSMSEGHWEEAGRGGYRAAVRSEEDAQKLEESQREIRTREDVDAAIKRVKDDLEEQPENTRYLTQLGDLYRMKEDWENARASYEKAHELDPQNFQVQERMGDLRLAELDAQIKELEEAGEEEKAKAMREERTQVALEDYQKRARARPQDFTTRYKLANILFQLERYKEAATEYQQASRDPKTRRPATYRLGLCLEKQGMRGMAIEQYEKAAQGASVVNQEVKDILYTLGSAYEREGQVQKALEAYKRVFDTDMNFKDVATKIEELYQKSSQQTQQA